MRFAEELLLLLHNDESGYFVPVPEWRMSCALAGAVLLDLSLEYRIDSDLETVTLADATPTGDKLLDPILEEIAAEDQVHSPQYWVERIARRADDIGDEAIRRLVEREVFKSDVGGFWTLSKKVTRTGRYPLVDGTAGEEIKSRIFCALFDAKIIPEPRDVALIGLVNYCGGFRAMLEPDEYEEAEERIEFWSGIDLIGRAIALAVRSSYSPPEGVRAARRRPMPELGLRDMLGSKTFRSQNLPKFFAEVAKEVGPVFRLKVPGNHMVVLTGTEMNHWVAKKGRFYLRTRDHLEAFQTEWGAARSIASMDGADHFRMRRTVRAGNSRAVVKDRLDDLFALGRRTFRRWGVGNVVPGEMGCQHLIGRQMAQMSVSVEPSDILLDDLLKFEYRALLVHVLRLLPRFLIRTPRMKRYRKRVLELYAQIHASHTPAQRGGQRRDLTDDLMELHQADPQFLPETDLGFALIAPIIAGHYTGSAMAFAVYELIRNPRCREQIAAEADALFASADPTAADLTPEAIDATRRFVMEVLRLYPVVQVHMRTAMNSFVVEGIEVPAYSRVLVAFPATHYMEEYFTEPDKFDIDRYVQPRNEHRQTGSYVPFGVGTHVCGGSGWTTLQMAANLLLIARHLELELVPADYRLKLSGLPKASPDKKFKFRVAAHRHSL